MKNKIFLLIVIVFCLQNNDNTLFAQGESLEQITTFSSRIKNPVVIDVKTDQQKIYFNVNNKSLYKYIIEVTFGDFQNLSPRAFDKKAILFSGVNKLFTFKTVNPYEPPILSYNTRYYIANSDTSRGIFEPYLIPIGINKTVELKTLGGSNSKRVFLNHFVMSAGDTVFNSRKGIVTALPGDISNVDRIFSNNSLEILHEDGTVGVYIGLNSEINNVKLGRAVIPGQPLGIIGNSKELIFQIFEIHKEYIKSIDIIYAGPDGQMISSENLPGARVVYSDEIIKKEMTKKEESKYEKHSVH